MVTATKLKQLLSGRSLPVVAVLSIIGVPLLVLGFAAFDTSNDVTAVLHGYGAPSAYAACSPAMREVTCKVHISQNELNALMTRLALKETQPVTMADIEQRTATIPGYTPSSDEIFLIYAEKSSRGDGGMDGCRARPEFTRDKPLRIFTRQTRVTTPGSVLSWIVLYQRTDTGDTYLNSTYGYN